MEQLVADQLIAQGKRDEGLKLLDKTISTALKEKLYYVSMDMFIDMGNQLAESDSARAVSYYQKSLSIARKNGYLIYGQILAEKLFNFYIEKNDSVKASVYSRQLLNFHAEKQKLDNASEIDYLDYVVKEREVDALTLKSKYQTASLVLAALAIILALAVIIVIIQNLKRIRKLNKRMMNQNSIMKDTLNSLELSQADNSRMIKMAAHDLRNPIGGIVSLTDIMIKKGNYSAIDLKKLELIKKASENSLNVVSDMLQFQSETIYKNPVDLEEMLQYCISILEDKATAKNLRLNLISDKVIIQASIEKLWRVMSNLISNAIKFSPVDSEINIKVILNDMNVEIQVQDNGIGIPIDLQDKIFDMGTEAKRIGTAGETPFGFGLAICKQFVEAHGGKIWVISKVGKGTTFFVSLPID
ncbi:sensor histidine kinase [Pedobacter jamesrossensis]|uniref:histidine kinase n=1 Tax=Pedobacter jamesrossensis TaxID=1908238 RepID=A0ABV8NLR5_9SPHI